MTIHKILDKYREKLICLENVVSVGIGQRDDRDVIVIMVSNKEGMSSKIPKKIEDYDVDIRETGKIAIR